MVRSRPDSDRMLAAGNVRLHVTDRGGGHPVIFVHGYTTTGGFWRPQAEALSGEYRTLCFDLRGHGRSEKPEDSSYTIAGFANDLDVLMHTLAIQRAVLVGLSMGGSIVLLHALEHPDSVVGMILADTTANGVGPDIEPAHVLKRIRKVGVERASAEVLKASFAADADSDLVEWAVCETSQAPEYVARQAIVSLGEFNVESRLGEVKCPTLIVVGREDRITPPTVAGRMHRDIANSRLVVVPNAGHFSMLEQPDTVTREMRDFLSTVNW